MNDKNLYQQILGIPRPWSVTDVSLKLDGGKIEVRVSAPSSADMNCPVCQKVCQLKSIVVIESERTLAGETTLDHH